MKTVVTDAEMEHLDEVMNMVDGFLQASACSEKSGYYVQVSVEEIFTNIVSYAYGNGDTAADGKIEISCELVETTGKTGLLVCFRDWGKSYNPLEHPNPDFDVPFAERPIGGLGIYMVKQFMDHVEYRREGGCNLLIIEKVL